MSAHRRLRVPAWLSLALVCACTGRGDGAARVRVREAYVTPLEIGSNLDSPAIYHGAGGEHWLIATAKVADVLIVYDAGTGHELRRVGGSGQSVGRFERPNGIVVLDDSLVLVVERDNARVQAFRLPAFTPLGTFGDGHLGIPYGIAAYRDSAGAYVVYVTDNYQTPEKRVPPLPQLVARVKQYSVSVAGDRVVAALVRSFGDTTDAGALRVVESIQVDPTIDGGRLLIAEELVTDSHYKVYSLDGRFLNQVMGRGQFPQQAEGLALYACGDTAGYWVATDQGRWRNTFHIFDRRTLAHVASFTGSVTNTTDGVVVTQRPFAGFPAGAFFASHFDAAIAAFSWADIAAATGVRQDC